MSGHRHSFGKERRLRRKRDIDALYAGGARVSFGGLTARYAQNGLLCSRIAIANARRWGSAPERNRVRRIVREVFRVWPDSGMPVDILVTQHTILRDISGSEIAHRVRRLFEKIK